MTFCRMLFSVFCGVFLFIVPLKGQYTAEFNSYSSFDELLKSSNPEVQEHIRVIGEDSATNKALDMFVCDSAMFEKFTSVKSVVFNHARVLLIDRECFSGMNFLRKVDLRLNHLTFIDLKSFRTSDEMKINTLDLSWNYITRMESSDVVLPELENLEVSHNKLKSVIITSDGFPEIYSVNADNNHISEIDLESETLEYLSLDGNRIKSFEGSRILLPRLKAISIKDNQLTMISSEMFLSLISLKTLYLNNNFIHSVDLQKLNVSLSLDLSRNSIKTMDKVLLPTTLPIRLTLDSNKLLYLESRRHLNNVELFFCKICSFHLIEPFFLANSLKNILQLDLFHNYLTTANIFNAQRDFKLTSVNLVYNKIRKIGKNDFFRLTNVTDLFLSYNDIRIVAEGAFDRMEKLKILYLSNNLIFQLPANIFDANSLHSLHIDGNNMPFFRIPGWQETTGALIESNSTLNNLYILYIQNNPLQCECVNLIRKWAGSNRIHLIIDNFNTTRGLQPACIVNNLGCRTDVGKDLVKDYWHLFNPIKLENLILQDEDEESVLVTRFKPSKVTNF
ncbi:leucine-rich repeat and death domain-containing protein 1-like [Phlebotomus argentipes]|uniref:leucine-rich repeat and death domain-containing protein 1-like n=1 Tax=Phlebotomus argentipes TaxID=94469 RepID=UPI00289303D2|nr:leucine-rich repeat and death domain-containing protein 1-like [Phlebotomus argentipes]